MGLSAGSSVKGCAADAAKRLTARSVPEITFPDAVAAAFGIGKDRDLAANRRRSLQPRHPGRPFPAVTFLQGGPETWVFVNRHPGVDKAPDRDLTRDAMAIHSGCAARPPTAQTAKKRRHKPRDTGSNLPDQRLKASRSGFKFGQGRVLDPVADRQNIAVADLEVAA